MRTIVVAVDGQEWRLPYSTVTAVDVGDYKRAVGRRLRDALEPRADLDIDEVAGLVWLAMRRDQPALTYRHVAEQVTLDAVASVGLDIAEEV